MSLKVFASDLSQQLFNLKLAPFLQPLEVPYLHNVYYLKSSVGLGFIPLAELYQKTLKNGIHSFPAWRSAFRGGCGEQAGKFACCVLGHGT